MIKKFLIATVIITVAMSMFVVCTGARNVSDLSDQKTEILNLPQHPNEIVFDDLNWHVPLGDAYRTTLDNGMVVYAAVDSALPLVHVEIYVRNGSLNDDDDKVGARSMLARLMRNGGTETYAPDTLDALIDQYALRFSLSQGEAHLTLNASFLAEFTDTAMNILNETMFAPRIDERRLERERSIMIENIRHRFVNPGPTLSAAYRKHKFPRTAASRLSTEESLQNISREHLFELHEEIYKSGNTEIIIAVSGMFDRDEMLAKLNRIFSHEYNPDMDVALPELYPQIQIAPDTRVLVVHRNINQAYVRMGLPLFTRPHEDYFDVLVMNYVLGGSGFLSRLGSRVRSDEGLTYSIHSRAESNYIYDGTLFVDFFTNTDSYPRAISIILEEIVKFIEHGITESELENARAALIAELPSSFRSQNDIVSTYSWNEFYRRDADHYIKYIDALNALTLESIQNVARKYIDADRITYTLVGDTAAINAATQAAANDGSFAIDFFEDALVISADELVTME